MNPKCPKCGKVVVTMSSYLSQWETDQEPYESGKFEEQRQIDEDLYINAQYCEKCGEYHGIWFEPELINNGWISIKDQPLPADPLIKIIRWNLIHKCSVSVFYYPKHDKKMPWCTGDLSHCWPEESFAPYWKPEIEAPPEVVFNAL